VAKDKYIVMLRIWDRRNRWRRRITLTWAEYDTASEAAQVANAIGAYNPHFEPKAWVVHKKGGLSWNSWKPWTQ